MHIDVKFWVCGKCYSGGRSTDCIYKIDRVEEEREGRGGEEEREEREGSVKLEKREGREKREKRWHGLVGEVVNMHGWVKG